MSTTNPERTFRVGVFEDPRSADRAVDALLAAGFEPDHITVIAPDDPQVKAHYAGLRIEEPAGAHAPAAATTAGAIGAVVGGLVTAAGVVVTDGLALLALGPLLAGAGGGAIAGGFTGAMLARGTEDEVADYYGQALEDGKILVAAQAQPDGSPGLAAAEQALSAAGAAPLPLAHG
jgi:hypothetical protein